MNHGGHRGTQSVFVLMVVLVGYGNIIAILKSAKKYYFKSSVNLCALRGSNNLRAWRTWRFKQLSRQPHIGLLHTLDLIAHSGSFFEFQVLGVFHHLLLQNLYLFF